MAELVCLGGPLHGHVYVTASRGEPGEVVSIDLVGLDEPDPDHASLAARPTARYAVEVAPHGAVPGAMRFVAVDGLFRKPALPATLRRAGASAR